MAIVSYTDREINKMIRFGKDRTDWKRLRRMKDEDIDYSDIPPMTEADLARAVRPGRPRSANPKKLIAVRVDSDIYAAVKKIPGYSARVNDMLRGMLVGAGVL